jgi:hypothetical protein
MDDFRVAVEAAAKPAETTEKPETGAETSDTSDATETTETSADTEGSEGVEGSESDAAESTEKPDTNKPDTSAPEKKDTTPVKDTKDTTTTAKPDWRASVRAKIATEERAKLDAEYQWAKDIPKEDGTTLRQFWGLANQDPIALIDRMVRGAATNPVLRGRLEQYLQHLYTPPAKPAEDLMPQPDSDQGYTTAGVKALHDWQQRQIMKTVNEQMAPLLRDRQQSTQQAQSQQQAGAYADRAISIISALPGFEDNREAIRVAFMALPRPWSNMPNPETHPQYRDDTVLLQQAYYTVTAAKNLEAQQKTWIADQRKKAGIGTVNPGSGSTGTTTSPAKKMDFREAVEQAAKRARNA